MQKEAFHAWAIKPTRFEVGAKLYINHLTGGFGWGAKKKKGGLRTDTPLKPYTNGLCNSIDFTKYQLQLVVLGTGEEAQRVPKNT